MNNGRQRPSAIQDFRVGLTEGDQEITEVNKILVGLGLIAGDGDDGHISAVSTCRNVYRRLGADVLADGLKTVLEKPASVIVYYDYREYGCHGPNLSTFST